MRAAARENVPRPYPLRAGAREIVATPISGLRYTSTHKLTHHPGPAIDHTHDLLHVTAIIHTSCTMITFA